MSDQDTTRDQLESGTEHNPEAPPEAADSSASFQSALAEFELSNSRRTGEDKQILATVVVLQPDADIPHAILDIGFKTEGILPLTAFDPKVGPPKPGDKFLVTVRGRDTDGYYELSLARNAQPRDFSSLEDAFAAKGTLSGTVTAVVKGGLTVDIGARAFMPASRTGTRDAAEMEKLVGQEIRCRITKLDLEGDSPDIVVDRRAVLEEEERAAKEHRYAELQEGDTVRGTVRSLTDYGAFVDIGGADGLLHIGDIAWSRITDPSDFLSEGQEIDVRILKIDPETHRIGLGMKQLLPHPWDTVDAKYKVGDKVHGTVTRDADFGAFVEIEPGVEGLIHISEMAWGKKVHRPSDIVKAGESVEAVILKLDVAERRMSLGLKQTLGDPWADASDRFAAGSQVEGPVTSFMKFGAFVQVADGVEGMIHISEIVADRRLNHPSDELRVGQVVKAKVLDVDMTKRQLKLSIKQLIPSGVDEFLAEHKVGDAVTGRILSVAAWEAKVELGEGVQASALLKEPIALESQQEAAVDFSLLGSMLKAKWQGSGPKAAAKLEPARAGQIRSFRITAIDLEKKKIELEPIEP